MANGPSQIYFHVQSGRIKLKISDMVPEIMKPIRRTISLL